jgi:hypothetical protein
MSQQLIKYLSGLNSTETQWGIYVDPENVDNYTCTQYGPDGWIKIGTPNSLSYGFQSTYEAVKAFLEGCGASLEFNGRTVRFNLKGLLEAYADRNERGNDELFDWLEEQAADIQAQWSIDEAENFVIDKLPDIISQAKTDSEYWAAEMAK